MASEDTKDPEIQFESITLLDCRFNFIKIPEKVTYHLELVGLERSIKDRQNNDGSDLVCRFDFDLMYGVEDPPCKFTCTYLASYSRRADANMTWEEFNDGMALAHVIAYLREFVMNVTTRSMLPRIFLSPLNSHALVRRYKESLATDGSLDE